MSDGCIKAAGIVTDGGILRGAKQNGGEIGQILQNPNSVIGLSTGKTTGNMHRIVSELYSIHPFETSKVTIFNVDELAGLPRSYTGSGYDMIKRQICGCWGLDGRGI